MDVTEVPAQPTLSIRKKVRPDQLSELLGDVIPRVFAEAAAAQLGPRWPYARYHAMSDGQFDVEAGVLLAKPGQSQGELVAGSLPKTKAAETNHVGPYEKLRESWKTFGAEVEKKGLARNGPFWEIYLTDPGEEPDPQKWTTRLVMPIK
jgi:AraC family transcriptional regulator